MMVYHENRAIAVGITTKIFLSMIGSGHVTDVIFITIETSTLR